MRKQTNEKIKVLPAMHALTRETQVPVIIALSTRDEMSPLFVGHIAAVRKDKLLENKIKTHEHDM